MYFTKYVMTLSASTSAAGGSVYSTVLGGGLYGLKFRNSTTVPLSTKRVISISRETTEDVLFHFPVPSSDKTFYPRIRVSASSGNILGTSFRTVIGMTKERLKATVTAASSKNSVSGVLTCYVMGA